MVLRVNCDLGEADNMHVEAAVMPYLDQASIACGLHAGSPTIMRNTLLLAKQHNIEVGAHPGYPDREGFGRRSLAMTTDEIVSLIHYQVAALEGMSRSLKLNLEYVKPHGALYNDMISNDQVRHAVMRAIAEYHQPLVLFIQATAQADLYRHEAKNFGIELNFEAFADRCYNDQGHLLPRNHSRAVHNAEKILSQVSQLMETQTVSTESGKTIQLQADTLCVHGDNPAIIECIQEIRAMVNP